MTVPGKPEPTNAPDLPPLKPRPVLFAVLAIVLVLWLVALVLMRLKTVDRHLVSPATQPASRPA